MRELDDVIAERSTRHASEAKAKRGADLSYTVEDGIHYVTWHTQNGYQFLSNTPDSNLALWHSIFSDEDAPARVERLLQLARQHGLIIDNDRPAWRKVAQKSRVPILLGLAAFGALLFFYTRALAEQGRGPRMLRRFGRSGVHPRPIPQSDEARVGPAVSGSIHESGYEEATHAPQT